MKPGTTVYHTRLKLVGMFIRTAKNGNPVCQFPNRKATTYCRKNIVVGTGPRAKPVHGLTPTERAHANLLGIDKAEYKRITQRQANWKWFGNPAHFIDRRNCSFHMTTQVGKHLISTLGEWIPKGQPHDYEPLGSNGRIYETIVFTIDGYCDCDCRCGLPLPGEEIECRNYMTAREANEGHLQTCKDYDTTPGGE